MTLRPGDLIVKDPSAELERGFDWTLYLASLGSGVTISTSTYAVSPSGLTLSSAGIVTGSLKTVVTLTGGTDGTVYTVTNHIVTNTSMTDERSIQVLVQNT